MLDPELQRLADKPIGNKNLQPDADGHYRDKEGIEASKRAKGLWLPRGRKASAARERSHADDANTHARRDLEQRRREAQLNQLMDYYAATDIPLDRIVKHCGCTESFARDELKARGRVLS